MRIDMNRESPWQGVSDSWDAVWPDRVDVCVVGAGIAGLSTAYGLTRAGRGVLVIDDGPIAGGQTGRTTAHLSNAVDRRYHAIERLRGADGARLAAQSHTAAIDFIERVVQLEGIDCDFERVDGFLFAAAGESPEELEREEKAALRAGVPVELSPRVPLDIFDTGPCLRFARQGQIQPVRYVSGLASAVADAGGRLITGVRVERVEGGKTARVTVSGGASVEAGAVVVATNTPLSDRLALHTKQAPYITYAIALVIREGSVPHCLLWDTGDPYHYVRVARDPSNGTELLIVGGEDHKTGQARDHARRLKRLEDWARERFPRAGSVVRQWSGQVQESSDGLAYIGRNPDDYDNVFVATGDSGMGMTHGTVAGLLLTDLILTRRNAWEQLYAPSRKIALTAPDFVRENLNVAKQYAAWLTPGEVSSPGLILNGSGAVVRRGLKKVAVYRDECGEVHECSAVCPHLGAIVTWNDFEKTWDCPAHGSRFDSAGRVIEGPADADLRGAEQRPAPLPKRPPTAPAPAPTSSAERRRNEKRVVR